FHRLAPGRTVRLRYAYIVTCTGVTTDDAGRPLEVRCTYDPATRGGGSGPETKKAKATLHWVSAAHAIEGEVRLYDRLVSSEIPGEGGNWLEDINPGSLEVVNDCRLEPALRDAKAGDRFQFERLGYFCVDPDSGPRRPVFNRTVTLRDTWARQEQAA